jgi:hypothetical protein
MREWAAWIQAANLANHDDHMSHDLRPIVLPTSPYRHVTEEVNERQKEIGVSRDGLRHVYHVPYVLS